MSDSTTTNRDSPGALGAASRRRSALRDWAIYSVLSAVIGIFVTLMTSAGSESGWPSVVIVGAMIGISINTTITLLDRFGAHWLDRRLGLPPALLRIPIFLLGGILGFLFAEWLATLLFPMPNIVPWEAKGFWLPFIGIFSMAVGFAIYAYEVLRARLEDSVAELKETEYAARELELARSIQERLLPPRELEGEGFSVAARNQAARWVAGDYYDVFRLGDGDVGLVVADVAGKGIGASLIMASAKAMLPFIAAGSGVADTLAELNARLAEDLGPREFVALAFARYSPETGAIELGNAGLPDPFVQRASGVVETLEVPGQRLPLGALPGICYESARFSVEPGDRLLIFTDGLPESGEVRGEPLGYERLAALLPGTGGAAGAWLDALFEALPATGGISEGSDDRTALVLQRHAPESGTGR